MFGALRKLLLVGVPLAALTFAPVAANEAQARPRHRSVSVWVNPGGIYVGTYPRYYSTYGSYYYYPRSYYYAPPVYSYGYSYYGYPYTGYYYYR
jgi:hypothetical protein